jgi:hypothetical protein
MQGYLKQGFIRYYGGGDTCVFIELQLSNDRKEVIARFAENMAVS